MAKFQFTHPGRGATVSSPSPSSLTECFNSRTPGGVRPRLGLLIVHFRPVSIHAPREGCDAKIVYSRATLISFNSRTPGGVRLPIGRAEYLALRVSIHAPREGCDSCPLLSLPWRAFFNPSSSFNSRTPGGVRLFGWRVGATVLYVSIHAPREGCDPFGGRPRLFWPVSIHAPREGCDPKRERSLTACRGFQFTHPGRGATVHEVIR